MEYETAMLMDASNTFFENPKNKDEGTVLSNSLFSEHFFPNTISQTVSRFSHTITSKSGTTGLQFIRGLCDPSGSRKK